jgi:uncharacterized coiled-coil protein SlyX
MARHTSSIIDFNEDAMIEAVLNSSDFESSVESVVDSSVEKAVESAIENEDIEDKIDSAVRSANADNDNRFEELESRLEAAMITINGLASALVEVHSKLEDLTSALELANTRIDNLETEELDSFNDVCLITAKFRRLAKLPVIGRFFA